MGILSCAAAIAPVVVWYRRETLPPLAEYREGPDTGDE